MAEWTVSSIVSHDGWRERKQVVGVDGLLDAITTRLHDGKAVLVEGPGAVNESYAYRMEQLYDRVEGEDKNGKPYTRRKPRFKGLLKVTDMDKLNRLNARRPKKKVESVRQSLCRNGDDRCACQALASTCRLEVAS